MTIARQMHYTSCRYGTTGSSGFQVRAASAGLPPEVVRQVKPWCSYRGPAETGTDGTGPSSFSSYPLDDGGLAITLVHRTGADYTGRPDNFFAHSLIFAPATVTAPPLAFLPWQGWMRALDPNDDVSPPAPLPEVGVEACATALANAKTFLSLDGHQALAEDILAALLLFPSSGRPVVIRDRAEHGLSWITAVQTILPLSWTLRLPMSTYQGDDRANKAAIACTTSGTRYAFGPNERSGTYAGFDLIEGKSSEKETFDRNAYTRAHAVAQHLVYWAISDPDRLAEFHRFADEGFQPVEIDARVAGILRLFEVKTGSARLPAADIQDTIDYIKENARVERLSRALDAVTTAAPQDVQTSWPALVELLAWGASHPAGDPGLADKACELWIAVFCHSAVNDPSLLPASATALDSLLRSVPKAGGRLWQALLGPGILAALAGARPHTPLQAYIITDILLGAVAKARKPYDTAAPALVTLLPTVAEDPSLAASLVRNGLDALATPDDQARLLCAVHGAGPRAHDETSAWDDAFLKGIHDVLTNAPAAVHERLIGSAPALLSAYLRHRLQRADDPIAAFDAFVRIFLVPSPEQAARAFPDLARTARDTLTDSDFQRLAAYWIEHSLLPPDDLLGEAVQAANATLQLGRTTADARLVSEIDRLAQEHGLALQPDMPLLIRFYDEAPGWEVAGLRKIAEHAGQLDESSYRLLLDKELPRLIAEAGDAAEHRQNALALLTPHHALGDFFDIYGRALCKIDTPKPLLVALDYWLPLPRADEHARWREAVIKDCAEAARHLSKDSWEHLSNALHERMATSDRHMSDEWRALLDRLVLVRRTRLEKVADRLHSIRNLVPGLTRRGAK
jgi:hypothetical protein